MPALSFVVVVHSRFPRDKARNAFHSFPFSSFFLFFSFSVQAHWHRHSVGGIGKLKGSIAEKAMKKGGMYKRWVRIFTKLHLRGRALWNAVRATHETTISPLKFARRVGRTESFLPILDYPHATIHSPMLLLCLLSRTSARFVRKIRST